MALGVMAARPSELLLQPEVTLLARLADYFTLIYLGAQAKRRGKRLQGEGTSSPGRANYFRSKYQLAWVSCHYPKCLFFYKKA